MQSEWSIGQHREDFEEPDLLVGKMGGPVNLEDAKALTEIYRELGTRRPIFVIVDVKDSPANAEARSYFTQQLRQEWFRGVVFVGAGMLEKAIGKAMTVAFYFTGKWKSEFLFAETLEEARTLVDRMRTRQSAKG